MTTTSNFLPPMTSVFFLPLVTFLDLRGQIKIDYHIARGHMNMDANNYISENCFKALTSMNTIYSC